MDHRTMKKGILTMAAAGMLLAGVPAQAKEAPLPPPAQASYEFVFDAAWYAGHYSDLKDAYGLNEQALWDHFRTYGMEEGRQASPYFDVMYYMGTNPDLAAKFGDDLPAYYAHYAESGYAEGRQGSGDRVVPSKEVLDNAAIEAESYVSDILYYTNKAREEAGVPALTLNQALCDTADARSLECISSYSHNRPDGKAFYTAAEEKGVSYRWLGENLGKGYKTGKAAVDGWLASPKHRENLLDSRYKEIGVSAVKAVTADGKGGIWFSVQEFTALR